MSFPFLLLPLLAPQETTPQEPTVEERIDALIEKTNALESFYARYKVQNQDAGGEPWEGLFELAYSAPDRGAVRMTFEKEEKEFRAMWLGTRIYALVPEDDGMMAWHTAHMETEGEPCAALLLLAELFPSGKTREYPLESGVIFGLEWSGMDDAESVNFELKFMPTGRCHLLEWLARMKAHAGEVTVEGADLVWTSGESLCRLASQTGFPVRIDSGTSKSGRAQFGLEELLLDELPEIDPFALPEEADEAKEDPSLTASIDPNGPAMARGLVLARVGWLLDRGDRGWDDQTRSSLEAVLTEVHRELIGQRYSPWIEDVRSWIDGIARHLREEREKDPPRDRSSLDELAAKARTSLEEKLEAQVDRYLDSLPDAIGPFNEGPLRDELLSTERSAATLAFDEVVRDPILAYFDEQTSSALGD